MRLKDKLLNIEKKIASLQNQSRPEEIANSAIHALGIAMSIAILVILVVFSSKFGNAWHITSMSIFGSTMIFLYLSSTLFHIVNNEKLKKFFRILDYIGIFLLIAGTYTPITLVILHGSWGWVLFGIVWTLAITGIILRILFFENIELILSVLYVLMGWILLIAIKPLLAIVPSGLIMWMLIGGACYMIGLIFLSWKNLPFHHAIWHVFVLGGSLSHFFGMLFYLVK